LDPHLLRPRANFSTPHPYPNVLRARKRPSRTGLPARRGCTTMEQRLEALASRTGRRVTIDECIGNVNRCSRSAGSAEKRGSRLPLTLRLSTRSEAASSSEPAATDTNPPHRPCRLQPTTPFLARTPPLQRPLLLPASSRPTLLALVRPTFFPPETVITAETSPSEAPSPRFPPPPSPIHTTFPSPTPSGPCLLRKSPPKGVGDPELSLRSEKREKNCTTVWMRTKVKTMRLTEWDRS
jgi:hypothetical protein